jgi:hypothetical protein
MSSIDDIPLHKLAIESPEDKIKSMLIDCHLSIYYDLELANIMVDPAKQLVLFDDDNRSVYKYYIALTCVAMMIHRPGIHIVVFESGRRAANQFIGMVRKYMNELNLKKSMVKNHANSIYLCGDECITREGELMDTIQTIQDDKHTSKITALDLSLGQIQRGDLIIVGQCTADFFFERLCPMLGVKHTKVIMECSEDIVNELNLKGNAVNHTLITRDKIQDYEATEEEREVVRAALKQYVDGY